MYIYIYMHMCVYVYIADGWVSPSPLHWVPRIRCTLAAFPQRHVLHFFWLSLGSLPRYWFCFVLWGRCCGRVARYGPHSASEKNHRTTFLTFPAYIWPCLLTVHNENSLQIFRWTTKFVHDRALHAFHYAVMKIEFDFDFARVQPSPEKSCAILLLNSSTQIGLVPPRIACIICSIIHWICLPRTTPNSHATPCFILSSSIKPFTVPPSICKDGRALSSVAVLLSAFSPPASSSTVRIQYFSLLQFLHEHAGETIHVRACNHSAIRNTIGSPLSAHGNQKVRPDTKKKNAENHMLKKLHYSIQHCTHDSLWCSLALQAFSHPASLFAFATCQVSSPGFWCNDALH